MYSQGKIIQIETQNLHLCSSEFHLEMISEYLILIWFYLLIPSSSIDLSNIAAAVYSTQLCNRLRAFLSAVPPSCPMPHVNELLIAVSDFERNLYSWGIRFDIIFFWESKYFGNLFALFNF